jgi:hypothetical protein
MVCGGMTMRAGWWLWLAQTALAAAATNDQCGWCTGCGCGQRDSDNNGCSRELVEPSAFLKVHLDP